MKLLSTVIIAGCVLLSAPALARQDNTDRSGQGQTPGGIVSPQGIKKPSGVLNPGAFRIKEVQFIKVVENNTTYLALGIRFNRDIDPNTVQLNYNVRLLKQRTYELWDSVRLRNLRIVKNTLTAVTEEPITNGIYRSHVRGLVRDTYNISLDCDGDGQGEEGGLPACEKLYKVTGVLELEPHGGTIPEGQLPE